MEQFGCKSLETKRYFASYDHLVVVINHLAASYKIFPSNYIVRSLDKYATGGILSAEQFHDHLQIQNQPTKIGNKNDIFWLSHLNFTNKYWFALQFYDRTIRGFFFL